VYVYVKIVIYFCVSMCGVYVYKRVSCLSVSVFV